MAKNELTATENRANLPAAFVDDDMLSGPTGFENVSASDMLIPRITILQKMSPQIEKGRPEYIQGAEYGDFCDTGTGEAFKELVVVPCFFAMTYLEWGPRNSGKGLVMNHGTDASILAQTKLDDKRHNVLPNGNYVEETAAWYVLNLSANRRRSFIPLSRTGLKHSRKWMTRLTSERVQGPNGEVQPPLWYRSWIVTTVDEQNNDGTWKSWKFTPSDPILQLDPTKTILREAKKFNEQARDGLVRGDVSSAVEEHAADTPF